MVGNQALCDSGGRDKGLADQEYVEFGGSQDSSKIPPGKEKTCALWPSKGSGQDDGYPRQRVRALKLLKGGSCGKSLGMASLSVVDVRGPPCKIRVK